MHYDLPDIPQCDLLIVGVTLVNEQYRLAHAPAVIDLCEIKRARE